jgi:hypothetical protein
LVTIRGQGGGISSNRWQGWGCTADSVSEAGSRWHAAKSEPSVAINGQGSVIVLNMKRKRDGIVHRSGLAREDDHRWW